MVDDVSPDDLRARDLSETEQIDLVAGIYRRGQDEFARFIGFSDGIFGFAMTLLISTVAVPLVRSDELGGALRDQIPDLTSFFVSFAVIGHYWMVHHRLFAAVDSVSVRVMRMNLLYLALIAFMPFPTALFGRYSDEPLSEIVYATALAVASIVQALMFRETCIEGLLRVEIDTATYRHVMAATLIPAGVFALSAAVAIFAAGWAAFVWILIFPLEWFVGRRSPEGARIFG